MNGECIDAIRWAFPECYATNGCLAVNAGDTTVVHSE